MPLKPAEIPISLAAAATAVVLAVSACSAEDGIDGVDGGAAGAGALAGTAGTGGTPSAGGALGAGAPGGNAGASAGGTSAAGGAGAPAGGAAPLPATCAEAAAGYVIEKTALDPALTPPAAMGGGNRSALQLPVAADATSTFVGLTRAEGGVNASVVAIVGGATITTPGAVTGGVVATKDGVAILLFDPNAATGERTWAAVRRVRLDGTQIFQTDLFRSANLTDEDTKGAPEGGRLGYLAATDQVVAYFGHTQRYDDGVRHQGGYLATLDASGAQTVLNGWFGSHNLDRRLLVGDAAASVIGLGDAYPEGIFFSVLGARPQPVVLYPLAAAGNGATNGQLGGMVDVGSEILLPFITNRSVPQDLDAGTWPDIDDTISQQIRDAAGNGTDVGLLRLPKSEMNPRMALTATWLEVARPEGVRLERLKSARYGAGSLTLLAWAEASGSGRQAALSYFTMVIDPSGAVCQPKTALPADAAFTAADDIVRRPDGSIVWASPVAAGLQLVTLRPR